MEKQFSIDSTTWNVNNDAAIELTHRSCNPYAVPDPCQAAVAELVTCKTNTCASECNADTGTCQLALQIELWRGVNLAAEVPELVSSTPPADNPSLAVTLDDVTYEVSLNSLNVDTPELAVYVAPSTVMGPGGEGVQRIGTIPAIAAASASPPQSLVFSSDGKEILRRRLSDYQVPFNLIVASDLLVDQSSTIPVGKLNANMRMQARAGL